MPLTVGGTAWPGRWRILVWSAVVVLAPLSTWQTVRWGWAIDPIATLWATGALHLSAAAIVAVTLRAGLGMILAAAAFCAAHVPTLVDSVGYEAEVWANGAVMAGLYAVWRTPERRRWPWLVVVVVLGAVWYLTQRREESLLPEHMVFGIAVVLAIMLFAQRDRRRRIEVLAFEQRARDHERLRHLESAAAVAEERARIAGELRDVLTRTTVDVVTRAERARDSVEALPDALGEIESAGRRALADIRALVATTRGDAVAVADGALDLTPRRLLPSSLRRSSRAAGSFTPGDRFHWTWRVVGMTTVAALVVLATVTGGPREALEFQGWSDALLIIVFFQLVATVLVVTMLRATAGAIAALALYVVQFLSWAVFGVSLLLLWDWAEAAVLIAVSFGVYAVLRNPDRRPLPWWGAFTAVFLVGVPAVDVAVNGFAWFWVGVQLGLTAWVFAVLAPGLAAESTRSRRFELDQVLRRAQDLDRMRHLEARAAVSEERARIARELHDVLAHTTTAIVLQAGAARRVARRSPADALEAVAAIESAGRAALGEIRQMISVSTGVDAGPLDAGAVPEGRGESLDQLPALVAAAGLPVDLSVAGVTAAVPPDVAHAAYRIVQEALTNVRKHAPDTPRVSVVVDCGAGSVSVRVTDDGPGWAGSGSLTGVPGGYGLVGMAERARRCGGSVTAGPRGDVPGWEVVADLPGRVPVPGQGQGSVTYP